MLNNFHFERCVSNRNARGLKFVTFTFTGVAPPRSIEMGLANSIETFNFFTHLESTQINTSSFQCLLEICLFSNVILILEYGCLSVYLSRKEPNS